MIQIQELITRIENNYDPEEIEIIIDKGDFDLNESSINMTVILKEELIEKWKLSINGYRAGRVIFKIPAHDIRLAESHPLLWEYNDIHASLYFNGETLHYYELIWDLIKLNKSLYDPYAPLFEYFNDERELEKLIAVKAGLLAKGPKSLLLEYAACLEKYGLKHSITNEIPQTRWDGEKRVIAENEVQVLLIGNSYIIADGFKLLKIA